MAVEVGCAEQVELTSNRAVLTMCIVYCNNRGLRYRPLCPNMLRLPSREEPYLADAPSNQHTYVALLLTALATDRGVVGCLFRKAECMAPIWQGRWKDNIAGKVVTRAGRALVTTFCSCSACARETFQSA